MKTCVIIPAFNVARTIYDVIISAKKITPSIIVIDDGSKDKTADIAKGTDVKVITHKNNLGKGAALKDGFLYAINNHYDAVITLDGDGQHDAEDIHKLLSLSSEADIIIGSRMGDTRLMPKPMLLTNIFLSSLTSFFAKQKIYDSQSGLRLIKSSVLKKVSLKHNHYEAETEQLIKAGKLGFIIKEVPIKTIYHKKSVRSTVIIDTWRFIKLFLSPSLYFYQKS